MKSKRQEKILEILNDNCGNCISGEEIARKLSITRNAVWKGINSLKKEEIPLLKYISSIVCPSNALKTFA